jgi:hypothetical protein
VESSGEVKRGLELLEQIRPIAQRLDAVLDEKLLPQIDGGSLALAIDLQHQRSSWFREMPSFDRPVPLPSVALAIEIDDPQEIKAAGRELLEVAEDFMDMVRGFDPSVPAELVVPEPTRQIEIGSTLYLYALPDDAQVDPAIAPHARLADKFLFLGYLLPHTETLVPENELQLPGPAGEENGAYSISFVDSPQWVDALAAWVDYAIAHAEAIGQPIDLAGFGDDDLLDLNRAEIEQTLAAFFDLLRCCRAYSSRSDIADGARRMHYLWRFEDLPHAAAK